MPLVPLPVTCALACTAGARALPVPVPMPLAAPTLADRAWVCLMRSVAARLGTLLAPLRVLPVPLPLPGSLSRFAPSAARALSPSAAAGIGALPAFAPSLLAACALNCPLCVSLGTAPVASCLPLRAPVAGTLPRLRAVPPLSDHAPGVLLPLQVRQHDPRRRTLGRRGADVPRPPRGERLGGERLMVAGVGVAGVGLGAVLCALPATHCGCGGSRRGVGARAGSVPRARGVPGAAARPAGAVERLAGAAVSTPCALPAPPSAAAVSPGGAPGARSGAIPPAGGELGARSGPQRGLLGLRFQLPVRMGPPPGAGRQGLLSGRPGWSLRLAQAPG